MKHVLSLAFLLLLFASCSSAGSKESQSQKISDSAMKLYMRNSVNKDSVSRAISLLHQAIKLNPNNFYAFDGLFSIQKDLGDKKGALKLLKQLEKMKPQNPMFKSYIGILLDQKDDSMKARKEYLKASKLYKAISDTMQKNTNLYRTYSVFRIMNLKLLGKDKKAHEINENVTKNLKNKNSGMRQVFNKLAKRSREEIIQSFMSDSSL